MKNGVFYKRNFIASPKIEQFKKILIQNQAVGKDNLSGFFPATYKSIIKNIINLKIKKAYHG